MEAKLSQDELAAGSARESAHDMPSGVFDGVKTLGVSLRGLAHDHLRIAALETRLAGESLVNMIAVGVVLAVLMVSAWLMLVGVGVLLLVSNGVGLVIAMLIAIAVHLGIAFVLFRAIRESSQYLGFPATLRSLDSAEWPLGTREENP